MSKGQKKRHRLAEAALGTVIGFVVALASQYILFPLFGIHTAFTNHLLLSLFFTLISIVRGYYIRKLFNYLHIKGIL